jgi:hypothetical protein
MRRYLPGAGLSNEWICQAVSSRRSYSVNRHSKLARSLLLLTSLSSFRNWHSQTLLRPVRFWILNITATGLIFLLSIKKD